MSAKIKVDPRTFKIINQSPVATTTTTESESDVSSDSDSLTSVNSEVNTVKVIKLDNSIQYQGGSNIQQPLQKQQEPQLQKQQQEIQMQKQPQKIQQDVQKEQLQPQLDHHQKEKQQQKQQYNIDVGSYLKSNTSTNQNVNNPLLINDDNTEDTNESITEEKKSVIESDTETESDKSDKSDKSEKQKTEEQQTQDVFDLTQNKLYQVLSALFEDSKGNNISEHMKKFCELFEKQNQTMEKILNQLVIMNSNHNKQIKIPELAQMNTKPAGSINEFRKTIEEIKKGEIKKN